MKTILLFLIFLCCKTSECFSQDSTLNKYGLEVIKDKRTFIQSVKSDNNKEIKNVKKFIPTILLDLKYGTNKNFMHQKLYSQTFKTYLRKPAVIALQQIQKELNKQGLGLKIFDAYRPYSVTEKMWELVKDDRYAADPKNGSGHNRGVAVDLTIINLKNKKELNMGTGFDNFTDSAHHDFKNLPADVLKNRILLRSIMEKYGFKILETEWWHYSLPNAKDFELLDLGFKDLSPL
jgi:D-alanyl-D-alanine dipeptidase